MSQISLSSSQGVNLSTILPRSQFVVEVVPSKGFSKRKSSQSCENVYGIDWYYHMVPDDKMTSLIDVVGEDFISQKFVVCLNVPHETDKSKNKHFFTAFDSYLDFIHYIKKIPREKWGFFEVILGNQLQKLYFDIEVYPKDMPPSEDINLFCNRLLTNLIGRIVDTFREHGYNLNIAQDVLLFSSSNDEKKSYHIIINNYAVLNNIENKILAGEILEDYPQEYLKFIDPSMYSSKQQLRLYQSQKPGSGRPKLFVDEWWYGPNLIKYSYPSVSTPDDTTREALRFTTLFAASCVTVTDNCTIIPILFEEIPTKISKPYNNDNDLVTEAVVKAVCERVDSRIFQIFSLYKVVDSLILLKRKMPAKCTLCDRVHEHENAFLCVTNNGQVYFHCRRKDDAKGRAKQLGIVNDNSSCRLVADVSDLIPGANLSSNHVQSLLNRMSQTPSPDNAASPNLNIPFQTPTVWSLHDQMRNLASNQSLVFSRR